MRRNRLAPLLIIPFLTACELAPTLPDATETRDAAALLTVMSDVLSGEGGRLFATNNAGELMEINLDAGLTGGTITIVGSTAPLDGITPKWTGISRKDDGTLFTSSRTTGDPRTSEACLDKNGTYLGACTHLYTINPWDGTPLTDQGSMTISKVSDIDLTPDGSVLYGNAYFGDPDGLGYGAGALVTIDQTTGVATRTGIFGQPAPLTGWYEAVSGGLTVDADGEIWATENTYATQAAYTSAARLHRVNPATGASDSGVYITNPSGLAYSFGFDALEALPDANRTLIAAPSRNTNDLTVYAIDRATGVATPIPLTLIGPAPQSGINGLETAPPVLAFESLDVTQALAVLDPQGLPAGDRFELEAVYALGAGSDGVNPVVEPVTITVGSFKRLLTPPAFVRVEAEGLYRYTNATGPLNLMELRDDGSVRLEASGLTLSDLLDPGVPVVLQIGNDVGGTTTDFDISTPGGGIPELDPGLLFGTTNKAELVLIDLAARTMTLVGRAAPSLGDPKGWGWADLAVTPLGEVFTVTRQQSGFTTDGCDGAVGTAGRCSHLFKVDGATGDVVEYVGNLQAPFASDIEFDLGGRLLGTFFANLVDAENGALAEINQATAELTVVGAYGAFDGLLLDNGGLAVDPRNGDLWAVESGFYSAPEFFRVDPATGAYTGDVKRVIYQGGTPTFRISGLEIVQDGRMFLTKGGGTGLFLLDPASGQIRDIPLTIDPAIQGALNGIDSYRAAVSGDVRDTYIQEYDPHRNDGANPKLRATKKERTLLGFDLEGLDLASVTSATLVLSVAPGSDGDFDWDKSWKSKKSDKSKKSAKSTKSQKDSMSGMPTVSTQDKKSDKSAKSTKSDRSKKSEKSKKKKYGRIGVWRLVGDFTEGNGSTGGLTFEEWVRGDGEGATWKCRADLDISNAVKDCAKADRWTGGKTQGKQTDLYMMTGSEVTVEFDITRDVQNGVSSWLVKAKDANGEATFWSREGAAAEGNSDLAPRVVITTN